MSRFHDLPVGARFQLGGEIYSKVNALLALHEASGSRRMIPRSADVDPLGEPRDERPDHLPARLDAKHVLSAFDAYRTACEEALGRALGTLDADARAGLDEELERASRAFIEALEEDR